ncbi:c-type cytochrome [Paenibacillus allorhizosphaerae]|uniref:Cytochrome c domain-containing protein n=1 Tax=Paenibacillus allorhizosphaerae TaxID=2849866 RepID=A0ABM8VPT2_9BACL|nr:cytochrome c [Paenibacillus allorhizosphaerae]CAG7653288.1 hypothetical protein PAECIP111802_05451 [Paenibacillus allorhizosphaerae]
MRMKWKYVMIAAVAASMMTMAACAAKPESGAGQQQAAGAAGGAAQGGTAAGNTGQGGGTAATGSTGQGAAAGTAAPDAAKTTPVNAEAIVKQSCIACHGDTLDGKGSPKKDLTKIGAKLTKEQIINQINNGGNGMPGLKDKLKPEEVNAVAEWLAAKK